MGSCLGNDIIHVILSLFHKVAPHLAFRHGNGIAHGIESAHQLVPGVPQVTIQVSHLPCVLGVFQGFTPFIRSITSFPPFLSVFFNQEIVDSTLDGLDFFICDLKLAG